MDNPDTIAQPLFLQARGLPREQRASLLEAKCKGQPELRRRVEELLVESYRRDGAVNGSPWDVTTMVPAESLREQPIGPGTLLGRYRILEQLGTGGMGDTNGFRCVHNLGMVPAAATLPIHHVTRNFAKYKPVSDEVMMRFGIVSSGAFC